MPDKVRLNKRKQGFSASIESWLDMNDSRTLERILSDGPIFDLVKRDAVEAMVRDGAKTNSRSKFLFSFLSSKLFLEHCGNWQQ